MHVTQHEGGLCPEARATQDGSSTNYLAGLLADGGRFRTWLAQATLTAAQPLPDVNVDGYVVTDTGLQALAEADPGTAPGTAAQVLRDAALYLERHGWIQGAYYDATSQVFTPAACIVGAIGMVCYGGPVDAPAQHFDDPGFLDFEKAVLHLDRYLLVEDGSESYDFNDAKGRTADQVVDVLRTAADTPAHELINALRVINTPNAQMAATADDGTFSTTDCGLCGAPGGYPYCTGRFNAQMSCADAVADEASDTTTTPGGW